MEMRVSASSAPSGSSKATADAGAEIAPVPVGGPVTEAQHFVLLRV
jgi:hypothetical protein